MSAQLNAGQNVPLGAPVGEPPRETGHATTRFKHLTAEEQAKVAEAFRRARLTLRPRTALVVNGLPTRALAVALRTLSKDDMDRTFASFRYAVNRRTYRGMLPKTAKVGNSTIDHATLYRAILKQQRKNAKRLRDAGAV